MSSSGTNETNVPSSSGTQSDNDKRRKIDNKGNLTFVENNRVEGDLNIISNYKEERKKRSHVQYNVPISKDKIVGREYDIGVLFELILSKKRVCITGMGGIGKTTLALHCADIWLTNNENPIQNIALINSENENCYENSIKEFATSIGISLENKSILTILTEIINYFEDSILLLVYDNVNSVGVLKDYLPGDSYAHVYVLATSQITEIDKFFHPYPLKVLNEEDSILLVESVLTNKSYDRKDIKELVEALGFLPVAILLAAAFINDMLRENENYHVQDYIKKFSQLIKEPFPKNFWNNYKRTVYTCLLNNINKIDLECTKTILKCMAYLNPTHIDMKMFQEVFNEEDVNKARRELKNFSIISEDNNSKYFSIHRLIQEVCRELDENEECLHLSLQLVLLTESVMDHIGFLEPYVREYHLKEAYLRYVKKPENNKKLEDRLKLVDCNLTVTENWPVFYYAVFFDHRKVVEMYFRRGFSEEFIKRQTSTGITPLHIACTVSLSVYIDAFLDCGWNINVQDENGNTAAHWAAKYKYLQFILDQLVESGADCDIVNNNGETVCDALRKFDRKNLSFYWGYEFTYDGSIVTYKTLSGDETHMLVYWEKLNNIEVCFTFIKTYQPMILQVSNTHTYNAIQHKFTDQLVDLNIDNYLQENEEKLKKLFVYLDFNMNALFLFKLIITSRNITIDNMLDLINKRDTSAPKNIPVNVFRFINLLLDSVELEHPKLYYIFVYECILGQPCFDNEPVDKIINDLKQFGFRRCKYVKQDCMCGLDKTLAIFLLNLRDKLVQCAVIHRISQESEVWKNVLEYILTEEREQEPYRLEQIYRKMYVLKFFSVESIRQYYLKHHRSVESTAKLISKLKEDNIDISNVETWPALWFAICDNRLNSIEVSRRLIRLGVNVNEQVHELYPLDIAIVLGYEPLIALIKRTGARAGRYHVDDGPITKRYIVDFVKLLYLFILYFICKYNN